MTRSAALAALACILADTAAGQTTPTERTAAGAVLHGHRFAADRAAPAAPPTASPPQGPDRDGILARAAAFWEPRCRASATGSAGTPRSGWKEIRAVDTLTRCCAATASRWTPAWPGWPPPSWPGGIRPAGSNGPMLGLIAEYDALRGTQGAFHGDQHNAQSPVAIAAAAGAQGVPRGQKPPRRPSGSTAPRPRRSARRPRASCATPASSRAPASWCGATPAPRPRDPGPDSASAASTSTR